MRVSMKSESVLGRVFLILLFGVWACLAPLGCADDTSSSSDEVEQVEGGEETDGTVEEHDGDVAQATDVDSPNDSKDPNQDIDQPDGIEEDVVDAVASTGPCDFWKQECTGGSNCYPVSLDYECLIPTSDGEEASSCEEHTDCAQAGLLCSPDGCAIGCSIDEFVEPGAPICVDNCQFGFEVIDLDMQLGYCLPDTTPGEWFQIQPETVKKEHVFKSVWMSGPDDIHLVGADGIAVHYQGEYWEILTEGYWPNLNAVWGFAPDDVWAVGLGGTIIRYDGVKWTTPGACTTNDDCDDQDDCTIDSCNPEGECDHTPTGAPGCCGVEAYATGWDTGTLEGWTVESLYPANTGLVEWQAFSYIGPKG